MIAEISPENEQYIEAVIANGQFQNRGQALNAAIELLKQREETIRDVNSGIDQLERGLGRPFDIEAMMRQIDERLDAGK